MPRALTTALVLLAGAPAAAPAQAAPDSAAVSLDSLVVVADPSFSTASSRVARALDFQLRPRESSQELLRLAPGLVIAQHAGGGKAEQIFLRGFDADHGTDVAVSVDATPVNLVSHAHGQGYADLHFLIPEVVEAVEVRKGPYDAEDGDLATAGAVQLRTRDRVSGLVDVRGGSFGTVNGVALAPFGGDASRSGGYVAAAARYSEGPFDAGQGYRRVNLFAKWTAPLRGATTVFATASAFDSRWDASGQVPERAVRAGRISRFGAIDPTEGGVTSRYELAGGLRGVTGSGVWQARAYAVRYRLDLFSNFTFFLQDTLDGDGIEQTDRRLVAGAEARMALPGGLFGRDGQVAAGLDVRSDVADVGLHHQRRRERLDTYTRGWVSEQRLSPWGRHDLTLATGVRLQLGLRGDLFRFAYGAGDRWHGIVSPKANLAVDLSPGTTLYANAGLGFHSNDARDVVSAGPADAVLPRAAGAELGLRRTWGGGSVAVAAWGLDLGSELVYVGDEGTTEAGGRTRRVGLDVETRVRLAPWLWLDADLNLARGRFRDQPSGANRIPLAPSRTLSAGLTVRDLGPARGGLRVRHVGARPADELRVIRARGHTIAEAFGAWRVGAVELFGVVDNLLDTEWNEAQFATTSRLRGESEPVTELHFTPGAGRSLQVGARYSF